MFFNFLPRMKEKLKGPQWISPSGLSTSVRMSFISNETTRVAEIKFNSSMVLNLRGGNKEVEM